jgi:hypothetical protein
LFYDFKIRVVGKYSALANYNPKIVFSVLLSSGDDTTAGIGSFTHQTLPAFNYFKSSMDSSENYASKKKGTKTKKSGTK